LRSFQAAAGRGLRAPLTFESTVVDIADQGRALVRHLALLCGVLDDGSPPALLRNATDVLLRLVLQSLRHNHSGELERTPTRLAASSVRRGEDYIAAHARQT
jgi:hypothetical protein